EYRRLPAAALLGEPLFGLSDFARNAVVCGSLGARRCESGERIAHGFQQHAAAPVQRVDRKPAPTPGEHQRRIDKTHVPAGVPAGKLEARGKEDTAPGVERIGECRVGRAIRAVGDLAPDADAADGQVALELHLDPLWVMAAVGDPRRSALETAKAARCFRGGLYRKIKRWPPASDGPPPSC